MEFMLLRDAEVTFSSSPAIQTVDGLVTRSSGLFSAEIQSMEEGISIYDSVFPGRLSTALITNPWRIKSKDDEDMNWNLRFDISFPETREHTADDHDQRKPEGVGKLKISAVTENYFEDNFLRILYEIFGVTAEKIEDLENVTLNLVVKGFGLMARWKDFQSVDWKTEGLKLNALGIPIDCTYEGLELPNDKVLQAWKQGLEFDGTFSLSVVLSDTSLELLYAINQPSPDMKYGPFKNALEKEILTDVEIIAGGGSSESKVSIKCHRIFLAGESDVFRGMFESGMKEATGNMIEIEEMSEKGVRAMLAFVYYRGIKGICEDSELAVEVLEAAEKYGISGLKNEAGHILEEKANGWFSADAAVELLLFAKKCCPMEGDEEGGNKEDVDFISAKYFWESLQSKAVKVLKWYTEKKPKCLMKSTKYQDIFKDFGNPQLGMEIGATFLRLA